MHDPEAMDDTETFGETAMTSGMTSIQVFLRHRPLTAAYTVAVG